MASGVDATADFSTINISGTRTITLSESLTIGNMIFGDTATTYYGWVLNSSGGSVLTLQTTTSTPTITVSTGTVTIGASLAGSQGFTMTGVSTSRLILSGSSNLLTGLITVNVGTLDLRSTTNVYTNDINLAATNSVLDAANILPNSVMTVSGNITGSGKINKTNSGSTLVLTGSNSHTGGTTLSDGTILIGNDFALGSGTLTLSSGRLGSADSSARTISNALSFGSSNLTLGAAVGGTATGNLTFTWLGTASIGGGKTWTVNNSTTATFNNSWTGNSGWAITKAGTGILVFNGNIATANSISVIVNAGTLFLNGTNSLYSGSTALVGGTLNVTKLADINTASSIGKGSAAGSASDLVFNGGTLKYTGAGDSSNRPFTIGTGGGTIDASGSGALALTGSVVLTSGTVGRTFTLTGTNTGANTFGANLVDDGSNVTSFVKSGVGKWILTGSNTYTGATSITGGELDVNGSLAAGSTVSVGSGATLGGSGKIGGNVNSTSGNINGSGLTVSGSATLTGASTLGGINTVSRLTISSGSTTMTGTTTVSSGTFSVALGATLNNNGVINGNTSVEGFMKGTSTINGDLALSGTLSPGNSPGTTTINGNLTLDTTAVLVMEVVGTSSHDLISVTGDVKLAGTLDLSSLSGLTLGDSITLIENTGSATTTTGYFSEIITTGSTYTISGASSTYTITVGETKYLLNYAANAGGDNVFNDVTLTVIPEPATWAMIMGGIGMLALGQRVRRR